MEVLDLDLDFSVLFQREDWKVFCKWIVRDMFWRTSANDFAEIQQIRLVTNLDASILPFANRNWASHSSCSPLFDRKTLQTFRTDLARRSHSNGSQQLERHSVCIETICLVHRAVMEGPSTQEILKVSEAIDPETW